MLRPASAAKHEGIVGEVGSGHAAVDPDQAKGHFRLAIRHIMTDTAKREGIGYIDPEKMKRTVDFVSQYFNITGVSAADVYTNRFTPKLFPKEVAF